MHSMTRAPIGMIKRRLWPRESKVTLVSGTAQQSAGPRQSRIAATGLWVVAALACLLGTYPLFAALVQLGPATSDEVVENFNAGFVSRPDRLLVVEGFKSGDRGWYLDSGASGRLVYRAPVQAGSSLGLILWLYTPAGVHSQVLARALGHPDTTLATDRTLIGNKLVLPAEHVYAPSMDIEFLVTNTTDSQVLVLDQLETYASRGADVRAPPSYVYLATGGLIALAALALLRRRRHALPVAVAMGAVVGIAVATRMTALFAVSRLLDPDAIGYRTYANRFQWWPLFDNGIFSGNFGEREPLFPMVVHAYFQILGSSDFHLRVVSATLSVAAVILTVVAARRLLVSWPAALGAGLMVAVSGPLISESTRGLRLELEIVLVLLLYIALARPPARRPVFDAAAIGLLGAALALTQTSLIPLVGVAVTVSFLVRYRPLPRAVGLLALVAIIVIGAAAGHRAGLYQHHHDAFYDTAGYSRWLANVEHFAYHTPLPHPELFPSFEDYQKFGPYFGPSITTSQYLFVIHSPQQYLRDSIAGLRAMFDTVDGFLPLASSLNALQVLLGPRIDLAARWLILLGMVGLCIRARRHPHLALIPAMVMTYLASTAFFFDHGLLERYRNTWQVMPLAPIAAAWLVEGATVVVARRFPNRWGPAQLFSRAAANLDLALFPISAFLAVALQVIPLQLVPADAVLLVLTVGILAYRRPTAGIGSLLLAASIAGARAGLGAGAAALIAVLARERPAVRGVLPLLILAPFAFAVVMAGGHPGSASLFFVGTMVVVVATVTVAAGQLDVRRRLIWLLAAAGPFAGMAYFVHPVEPSASLLIPAGVVAAVWLHLRGQRWALQLALLDLTIVVFTEPIGAWLGILAALAYLVISSGLLPAVRLRAAAAAAGLAGLAVLAGVASLGASTPPATASWRTYLASTDVSIRQQMSVDRAGDDSIWIFGRRDSAAGGYPVRVDVNGATITADLNSLLTIDQMAWVRLPLIASQRPGDRIDVQVTATGQPDPTNRYIEIGGVYGQAAGITSAFWDGSRSQGQDLSPDAGIQAGTFLIVLGDDSMPRPPAGLPAPLVQGLLQPPVGAWSPGESAALPSAREQAGTSQLWSASLRIASENPLRGLGDGRLAATLNETGGGFGPGLTARNEYLQAAAEWGLPGLAGLLIVLVGAAWFVRRSGEVLPAALLLLTVISMAGESVLLEHSGAAATWLVIGLCLATRPLVRSQAEPPPTAPDPPAASGATASPTARA